MGGCVFGRDNVQRGIGDFELVEQRRVVESRSVVQVGVSWGATHMSCGALYTYEGPVLF